MVTEDYPVDFLGVEVPTPTSPSTPPEREGLPSPVYFNTPTRNPPQMKILSGEGKVTFGLCWC